jgi:hypothetical protein
MDHGLALLQLIAPTSISMERNAEMKAEGFSVSGFLRRIPVR